MIETKQKQRMKKRVLAQTKPVPVIVVGTGHHFQRNIAPALHMLEEAGRIRILATVDIVERSSRRYFTGGTYIKRNRKSLALQLAEYKDENPLVILGHTNSLHAKDAHDLVSHGFQVAVEKPYALEAQSMSKFLNAAEANQSALLEYYLTMKSAPLLLGFGKIHMDSFYLAESIIKPLPALSRFADSVETLSNILPRVVGDIKRVEVEVLEGEGETGTVEGRGMDTIDMRSGGGMILDMGTHAFAPLIALEEHVGVLPEHSNFSIRIAHCQEYMKTVKRRFGIPEEHIGETYAEISATSSNGTEIIIRFGKYVFGNRNRRGMRIIGAKGTVYMDWNSCTLVINDHPVIEMHKNYYPVLRSVLAHVGGEPLFTFDAVNVAARSQKMVFDVQRSAYKNGKNSLYSTGSHPDDIFTEKEEDAPDEIEEEAIRPQGEHDIWLGLLKKELPKFFPTRKRKQSDCPGCNSAEADSEFTKLGFTYKWCKNCFSLYVSPRPSEKDIDAYYAKSKSMKFYGEKVFKPTIETRHEQQIAPLAEWVTSIISKYAPHASRILDFMPKYFTVWAEDVPPAKKRVELVDPVYPFKLPPSSKVTNLKSVKKKSYDVVSAIDVLDHRADPAATIESFSELLKPGGLLLIGVNSGSGFEYQVLGQDSHRLVPPNRLNLLSIEAVETLLQNNGFEIIDEATPGKLDIDIVLKTLLEGRSKNIPRFVSYLLHKRETETWESLQDFLREHKLSSYLRIAARKK